MKLQITIVLALSLSTVLVAQTLPSKDALKKGNLKAIEQKVAEKAAQAKQKAVSAIKTDEGIPLVGDLSDADEQALGREVAGRLLAANRPVSNDSLQRYVNAVGSYIVRHSARQNLTWTFCVIEADEINAFAIPGGYIVVTSGLYKTLKNEAELAGVLGHEIAHVNLRHHVRLMQQDLLIAKGRDFLVGKTKQESLKSLAGSGAQICARALDRNAEFESDRVGLEFMARAGYDPYAYLDVLDRMGVSKETNRFTMLYKTHPSHQDRYDALKSAIALSWGTVQGVVPARWIEYRP